MPPLLTRRRLFAAAGATALAAAAAAAAGVETGVLPGRSALYRRLGLDGPAGHIPDMESGPFVEGTFASKARLGKRVGWAVSYPPGSNPGDALPVVVVLHGFGGDHTSAFGSHLGLDHFLAQAVSTGSRPFALASVDGGNTYWHRRASGEDSGRMVVDELLPLLGERGLDTSRLGLTGWSMGAYGALLLASELGRSRVRAASGMSVALWPSASRAATGAFDGAADFAAHDLYRRASALKGIPLRVDCGTGDGFRDNDRALVAALPSPVAGGFEPGGHDMSFWRRMAAAHLAFLASHLA